MRVLGIDPGSRFTGYGIIDVRGVAVSCVTAGVLAPGARQELAARLTAIFQGLVALRDKFRPDAVAIEGVFTNKNARSALILGQARGVALLVPALAGLPVFEYSPARVKSAVGAGGAGSKASVAYMVRRLTPLVPDGLRADAYDALAVALCHAHRAGLPGGARSDRHWPGGAVLRPAVIPARAR